jgi:hypothetical protein
MKKFVLLIFILFVTSCSSTPSPVVAPLVTEKNVLKNYVTLDLKYEKYSAILTALTQEVGPLKNRGEAHITLITPPEFNALTTTAGSKITAEQIHELFKTSGLTDKDFKEICLAHGQREINGQKMSTYYVVVKSKKLLKWRQQVAKTSQVSKKDFNPNVFYPHITLGFTDRDLHFEDGLIKNSKTCDKKLARKLKIRI